jgi:hypothetical protein
MATLAERRKRFKAALALAETTAERWATEVGGVTSVHLSYVLNGRRESPRLIALVDEFIAEQLGSFRPVKGQRSTSRSASRPTSRAA